jgi:SAM-dependent methyltransferase
MNPNELENLDKIEENHWWYKERRRILKLLLRKFEVKGTALDIGAGAGRNTRVLLEHGLDALAIENEETGINLCKKNHIPCLQGDVLNLPFAENSFSLITLMDVLEHIEDHEKAIKEIYRILKVNGKLILSVPLDMKLWSSHDEISLHKRRYDRKEILQLIEKERFDIILSFNWNSLMKPIVYLRRKHKIGNDLIPPSPMLNKLLNAVIVIERTKLFTRIPGVSFFVVAQKIL